MFNSLRSVSDQHLLSAADAIVVHDRKLTLKLLAHLHEIERRKLYLTRGYSSMFDYCRSRLRFSEGSAMRRIKTARCVARFPELHALLESGEVNLMSVALIARVLKPENAVALVERIRGKSKREVEAIVAEYEPRTLLPPDRVRTVVAPTLTSAGTPAPTFTATGGGKNSAASGSVNPEDLDARDVPKFERHSVIQFTAREEFMAKVARVRTLVWHQLPNATFEQLFELALDELIVHRDPQERQKRREQRASVSTRASGQAGNRYVPASARDRVFLRDGFRCTYVAADGRRCSATVALQVDHIRPIARGGASTTDNLRILCAQHNRLEGERLMGRCALPG
jgi:hypothetical protein